MPARSASPNGNDEALRELAERARSSGATNDYRALAGAMLSASRVDDAIALLSQLLERDDARDADRLSLAIAYSQVEQIALARHHLLHLVEHSESAPMREDARRQLEYYDAWLGLGPLDQELARLQEASLRERCEAPDASAALYVRLARFWLRRGRMDGDPSSYPQVARLLEGARRHFPLEPAILEILISCYLRDDPEGMLDETMRELDRVDPDSDILKALSGVDEVTPSTRAQVASRVDALFAQATQGEPASRHSALQGLRQIVANTPQNPAYREAYAFALLANDEHAQALEQARLLARGAGEGHAVHFNIGQIFWFAGDAERGRKHLDLASRYATSPEEQEEVLERVRYLESRA
ncbi:MAG TPA: hypothetical protein VGC79_07620 [Polyangiaceae bacterium]